MAEVRNPRWPAEKKEGAEVYPHAQTHAAVLETGELPQRLAADAALRSSTVTLRELVEMAGLIPGPPVVVSGADRLEVLVRRAPVMSFDEGDPYIERGDAVLVSDTELPPGDATAAHLVGHLNQQGIVGLIVRLAGCEAQPPAALVQACRSTQLPLIVVPASVDLADLSRSLEERLVVVRRSLLQVSSNASNTYTQLIISDADARTIVDRMTELAGCPVIFENLMHQVVAFNAYGAQPHEVLYQWASRSRRIPRAYGTLIGSRWIAHPLEVRGEHWGRVVALTDAAPTASQITYVEFGTTALTIRLMIEGNRDALLRDAERETLTDIVDRRYESLEAMHAKTAAFGNPTAGKFMSPLVVLGDGVDALALARAALDRSTLTGIVGELDERHVGVLLLSDTELVMSRMTQLSEELHRQAAREQAKLVVSVGPTVHELRDVKHAFAEALFVARSILVDSAPKPLYSVKDVQVGGFLYSLRSEPKLHAYVERTLGPLRGDDVRNSFNLEETLSAFIKHSQNKSLTAQALNISRQTLYDRLARIERLLNTDLADPESMTSLHVAILAAASMTD